MPASYPKTENDPWTHPAAILVATDLSDLDRLMPFAFAQATETGARLILLHVLAPGATIVTNTAGVPCYDPAASLKLAVKALVPWCDAARRESICCDALVREGDPAQLIAASASQFQADRVLLGTRRRSKPGKLPLGSVAEEVLHSVNLPVFTVGPEAHLPAESEGLQKLVLHATTLSVASRPSATLACRMATSLGARLLLLHVLPPVDEMKSKGLPTGQNSVASHELSDLAAETGASSSTAVEPHVVHGNPLIEILAEASERNASLIVLGATERPAFEDPNRNHLVYRVLANARCPVLTLRKPHAALAEAEAERLAMHQ
ncbi:MAG: universal stress protein [Terracidiphilus sp.]|jgi:nucleotide-binding universal stress UspA family protein